MGDDCGDCACFMAGTEECKGEVMRFQIGASFLHICVRHCVLLLEAFDEAGF